MKPIALYTKFARILDHGQSLFLLLIRIYIGYQSVISGWAHLHHIDQTAQFFATLHIPMPKLNVIISATTELIGGALLLVGFGSRVVALVLAGNFFVAIWTYELSNYDFSTHELLSSIWNNQNILLNDTAFPFFATAVIILLFGPGWFSIDGIIRRLRGQK
ncbi:MAG: DoxX family protein [Tepidisphaeraceae bacterium]|jgi:putative oxidoreductase